MIQYLNKTDSNIHVTYYQVHWIASDNSDLLFQHIMAAMTHKKCYLYDMSAMESTEVHTSHGLHTLEVCTLVMAMINTVHATRT